MFLPAHKSVTQDCLLRYIFPDTRDGGENTYGYDRSRFTANVQGFGLIKLFPRIFPW